MQAAALIEFEQLRDALANVDLIHNTLVELVAEHKDETHRAVVNFFAEMQQATDAARSRAQFTPSAFAAVLFRTLLDCCTKRTPTMR